MYGDNNYFFYRGFKEIAFLCILPFFFFTIGIRMFFMSPYPFIIFTPYAVISLIIAIPRMIAGRALRAYKKEHYQKALEITQDAVRFFFCPEVVKLFFSHLLILKKNYEEAESVLNNIKTKNLTYSDEAKICANRALIEWKKNGPEKAIECIKPMKRTGADEGIYFVAGKLLNYMNQNIEARKYNEEAIECHVSNKYIHRNLCYSYYLTKQYDQMKARFREIYHDLGGADIDTYYIMAQLKKMENKNEDCVSFLKEAMKLESASTDLVSKKDVKEFLSGFESITEYVGEFNEV